MRYKKLTKADATIPTSSMADIAFLLIIFFMVTSVFSATMGLTLTLPGEESESEEGEESILIHVQKDRTVVDCSTMEPAEWMAYIEGVLARSPNKPIILYTSPDAPYSRMVEVYDRLLESDGLVTNLFVPTASDLEAYVEAFGENPLESACP